MQTKTRLSIAEWSELDHRLRPDFMKHVLLTKQSLSYPCVREAYAHDMQSAGAFAQALLGSDPKHRYDTWLPDLIAGFHEVEMLGVTNYVSLVERIATRDGVEELLAETQMGVPMFAGLVYYLRYWVIPQLHPTRDLIEPDDAKDKTCVQQLKAEGIVFSLDLLEHARKAEDRRLLSEHLRIPQDAMLTLVHRADIRRLPFHSRKTTNYLIQAGAGSMAELAAVDPQELVERVIAYGKTIGKDLRYGIEPASSALIARVLPPMIEV
jgi:hypothetical protein